MFGDSLRVFERKTGRWDPHRRTPSGIGHARHLYSSWSIQGKRGDGFEQFLATSIDTPCADAMKKTAVDPSSIDDEERQLVARFIGFAAARTRNLLEKTESYHLESDPTEEWLLREWCKLTQKEFKKKDSDRELLRDSLFRAAISCGVKWTERILAGKWHFLRTTRNAPFVVSDWPAAGILEAGHWLLTFPISSEVALLASSHPDVGFPSGGTAEDVRSVNLRTIYRGTRFIVCHKDSFPGDDCLSKWTAQAAG